MLKNITFWLKCARPYSIPITIFSWAVIFIYSLKMGGNAFFGLFALLGIILVHLATNLSDDYFDYKILSKDEKFFQAAKNCKCAYLKNNQATIKDLRNTILTLLGVAGIIGAFLFFMTGKYVALLAIVGGCIAITYPIFSSNGLGEIAVIAAYGPLLFEGVYYVMTKNFSLEVLFLSFACALITNTILYAHMLMDFDQDECSHKTTLCRLLKTKTNALNFILVFYILSFIILGYLAINTKNFLYFLPFLTIPMIIELYIHLKAYNNDKTNLPQIYPWHKPLENWNAILTSGDAPFYFRFLYSRNIMVLFMFLICIAIIFG